MSDLSFNNFTVTNLSLAISPEVNYTSLPGIITNPNSIGYIETSTSLLVTTLNSNMATVLSFSNTFIPGTYMIFASIVANNITNNNGSYDAFTSLTVNGSPPNTIAFNCILGTIQAAYQSITTTYVWANTSPTGTVSLQGGANGTAVIATIFTNYLQVVRIG